MTEKVTKNTIDLSPAPIIIWANIRLDLYYQGLPDDLRGQYDAMRYAKKDLTEDEYTELYKRGSDAYRSAVDATVRLFNMRFGN